MAGFIGSGQPFAHKAALERSPAMGPTSYHEEHTMTEAIMSATPALITERLAYPSGVVMKYVYKIPILLYRLGLGRLIGCQFMIMTTTGRKSGLPRHTAIEYHQRKGRKYVLVGWARSDWYQNLLASPLTTSQTATGTEGAACRAECDRHDGHPPRDQALGRLPPSETH
jgi:deazaflavin-dependent oxidoreductase (nitroreductase family)